MHLSNNMSQLALQLIEKEKKEKTGLLDLGYCGLTPDNSQLQDVWVALGELTHLETLILSNERIHEKNNIYVKSKNKFERNLLHSIPAVMLDLINLKKLVIAGTRGNRFSINKLENLPKSILRLSISHNQINKIENLPDSLIQLYIGRNQISKLENLPDSLIELDIHKNRIIKLENLPDSLIRLDIFANQISKIENLPNSLNRLTIFGNQISKLGNLPDNLDWLDIGYNQIKDLEPLITFIERGIRCDINGNPLENPPMKIAFLGNEAILKYFKELKKGNKIPNDTLKLILIGNTTSGKTSLIKYLMHEEFNLVQNSTHGMQITSWQPPELEGININIWDFGGQEYYHATHRLFLSNNAVYILLWETATNCTGTREIDIHIEGLEGRQKREYDIFPYEYWLESVRYYAKDSEVFVVQNKTEEREPMPAYVQLRYDLERSKEFHICIKKADDYQRRGEGQKRWRTEYETFKDTLLETLRKSVAKYDLVSYWVPIREAILAREENHLDLADFEEICQAAAGDEVEIAFDLLMIYLRDIASVILYYAEDAVLKDTVFIKPNWLNQNIYNILNYKVLDDEGEFDDAHVERVVGKTQAENFVALMKQFGLIFDLPDEVGKYVSPQYLPDEYGNPKELRTFKKHIDFQHAFTLYFPKFLPKSVMNRFLSKYGSKAKDHLYWKYGIGFYLEEKRVYATYNFKEKQIRVEVQDNSKRVAALVFQTLYDIIQNDEFEVILEGQKPMLWRDIRRDGGRLNPSLVRAYEHLIHPPKNEITPTMKKIFISYSHEDMKYKKKLETAFAVQKKLGKVELWNDQEILAGDEWNDEIFEHLESADIIVLLFSPDFFASNFIWDKELPVIMRRFSDTSAKVIPILLRPCDWKATEYAKIQAVPTDEKTGKLTPINQWQDQDEAWATVVKGIKKLLH